MAATIKVPFPHMALNSHNVPPPDYLMFNTWTVAASTTVSHMIGWTAKVAGGVPGGYRLERRVRLRRADWALVKRILGEPRYSSISLTFLSPATTRRGQKKCLMSGAELVRLPCPNEGDRRGQS